MFVKIGRIYQLHQIKTFSNVTSITTKIKTNNTNNTFNIQKNVSWLHFQITATNSCIASLLRLSPTVEVCASTLSKGKHLSVRFISLALWRGERRTVEFLSAWKTQFHLFTCMLCCSYMVVFYTWKGRGLLRWHGAWLGIVPVFRFSWTLKREKKRTGGLVFVFVCLSLLLFTFWNVRCSCSRCTALCRSRCSCWLSAEGAGRTAGRRPGLSLPGRLSSTSHSSCLSAVDPAGWSRARPSSLA